MLSVVHLLSGTLLALSVLFVGAWVVRPWFGRCCCIQSKVVADNKPVPIDEMTLEQLLDWLETWIKDASRPEIELASKLLHQFELDEHKRL